MGFVEIYTAEPIPQSVSDSISSYPDRMGGLLLRGLCFWHVRDVGWFPEKPRSRIMFHDLELPNLSYPYYNVRYVVLLLMAVEGGEGGPLLRNDVPGGTGVKCTNETRSSMGG